MQITSHKLRSHNINKHNKKVIKNKQMQEVKTSAETHMMIMKRNNMKMSTVKEKVMKKKRKILQILNSTNSDKPSDGPETYVIIKHQSQD